MAKCGPWAVVVTEFEVGAVVAAVSEVWTVTLFGPYIELVTESWVVMWSGLAASHVELIQYWL